MPDIAPVAQDATGFLPYQPPGATVPNDTVAVSNDTVPGASGETGFLPYAPPGGATAAAPEVAKPSGYFDTLKQMFSEGGEQVGAGLKYATQPWHGRQSIGDFDTGVTQAVGGALQMVGAPFNAAVRAYGSQPLEEKTGIPKEYTELALSALPLPMKRLPALGAAAKVERADHIENLFNTANEAYEAARKSPVTFAPEQVANFKGDLLDTLKQSGHRDFTAPKTFRTLDELSTTEPTSAGDAIAVRKVLSKLTKSPDEGSAAVTAMKGVDDLLSAVPEADVARKNYAAASRAETINDALTRAQLNAETSGSGTNLDNTTRQAIKSILLNPKARRGLSEEELAQMAQISRGTFVGNVSRWVGNMLGGGHSAMGVIGGEVVGGHMGAAAAPVIGGMAKKFGSYLTQKQVSKLDALMRSRTPEAQAKIVNPLNEWNAAAEEFRTSPVARNLARVSIASRNLSNNFADVGVNLSPENLIRSVLPSTAASEGTP